MQDPWNNALRQQFKDGHQVGMSRSLDSSIGSVMPRGGAMQGLIGYGSSEQGAAQS